MKKWMPMVVTLGLMAMCMASGYAAEGEGGGKAPASLLENMQEAGFMEYILLFVSIAGLALMLQAIVTLRSHLLRPPELSIQLIDLVSQGDIQGALDAAQADSSFLGAVATATLSNHQ